MTDVLFSALGLPEKLEQAVDTMGFATATPIQAQTIPLIRSGADVIARSQTGTGKTVAFSIPSLERIDTKETKPTVQVLILCPTRELAQQAGEEIRKLARFMPGIRPVEVYGGADMERQFIRLRRANLVIGTPGRIMDHMRRKTLKLDHLKMIVLDEADEMLNMGFKEDIETILLGTPADRQTILFSATMPPSILALAGQFQRDPQTVEIDKGQVTIQRIEQTFVSVPLDRKPEALILLLRYHHPTRALIFCNTKRMVDELTATLSKSGFSAESIHGDLSQSQRTSVMNSFKHGKTEILIATDVAARGIDVNDLDYVFNYDIPMTTEYYVHRIGRTGRAGKSGCAITICSGKRQMYAIAGIARQVKSEIRQTAVPSPADIALQDQKRNLATMEALLTQSPNDIYVNMAQTLVKKGYTMEQIAAAALQLQFPTDESLPAPIPPMKKESNTRASRTPSVEKGASESVTAFTDILFNVGSANRTTANHLIGAITELSGLSGKEIGQIQIDSDHSVVRIPSKKVSVVMEAMSNCKICGKATSAVLLSEPLKERNVQFRRQGSRSAHYLTARHSKRKNLHPTDPVRHKPTEGSAR